jgi:formylglycine-generating enzyme required for sulfatase activity
MYRNHLSPLVFPYPWASDWGEDQYGLWIALTYNEVRHAFRWIPLGRFSMGSHTSEKDRYDWEDQHQITLSRGFWLAETTVTQALWQAVMNQNPSHFKGGQRPVEQISWEDAKDFIDQFNTIHPELQVRLPWEAEWEYACRAGTKTAFNFSDQLSLEKVNYNGHWDKFDFTKAAKQETANVKSNSCNDWGLYEMHGNVWEWCEDVWQHNLGKESIVDPWNEQSLAGAGRVIRGGSWDGNGRGVRSAIRGRGRPDGRDDDLGFRLALGH